MILKVASSDETSRRTGGALGLYQREVRFYSEVAPLIGGPLAPCYAASFHSEDDTFCLLLGDAGPARQGDEITGATRADADIAIAALADLHRPVLGSDDARAHRLAQPAVADQQGSDEAAPRRLPRALFRSHPAGAPGGLQAIHGELRRLGGARRGRPAGTRARRLPAGQPPVRRSGERPAADRRRLADRRVGPGAHRSRVLPRLRTDRREPAGMGGGAAARLPRGARRRTPRASRSAATACATSPSSAC